jgi:hypothetical protein
MRLSGVRRWRWRRNDLEQRAFRLPRRSSKIDRLILERNTFHAAGNNKVMAFIRMVRAVLPHMQANRRARSARHRACGPG